MHQAVNDGQGVILLSAHFTTLELSGRVLKLNIPPFDAVYRKSRNPFTTEMLRTGRERSAATTIEKRDIKKMVRSLREGRIRVSPNLYNDESDVDRLLSRLGAP